MQRLDEMTIGFDTLHDTSSNGNGNGHNGSHTCVRSVTDTPARRSQETSELEEAVRTILRAVGEDPDRPGLLETPRRVAKMYREMFAGLHLDPGRHLDVTFPEDYNEIVLVRDIPFTSMCEHHLLPFSGVAHVAYLPDGRVTGLSKLARVVEEVARRPQVQERMTATVADLIDSKLGTAGVAVMVRAEHSCMCIRGVRKPGSSTVTCALRGVFKTDTASRAEIMSLINNG
jgi:GTP cyclohydrolase I